MSFSIRVSDTSEQKYFDEGTKKSLKKCLELILQKTDGTEKAVCEFIENLKQQYIKRRKEEKELTANEDIAIWGDALAEGDENEIEEAADKRAGTLLTMFLDKQQSLKAGDAKAVDKGEQKASSHKKGEKADSVEKKHQPHMAQLTPAESSPETPSFAPVLPAATSKPTVMPEIKNLADAQRLFLSNHDQFDLTVANHLKEYLKNQIIQPNKELQDVFAHVRLYLDLYKLYLDYELFDSNYFVGIEDAIQKIVAQIRLDEAEKRKKGSEAKGEARLNIEDLYIPLLCICHKYQADLKKYFELSQPDKFEQSMLYFHKFINVFPKDILSHSLPEKQERLLGRISISQIIDLIQKASQTFQLNLLYIVKELIDFHYEGRIKRFSAFQLKCFDKRLLTEKVIFTEQMLELFPADPLGKKLTIRLPAQRSDAAEKIISRLRIQNLLDKPMTLSEFQEFIGFWNVLSEEYDETVVRFFILCLIAKRTELDFSMLPIKSIAMSSAESEISIECVLYHDSDDINEKIRDAFANLHFFYLRNTHLRFAKAGNYPLVQITLTNIFSHLPVPIIDRPKLAELNKIITDSLINTFPMPLIRMMLSYITELENFQHDPNKDLVSLSTTQVFKKLIAGMPASVSNPKASKITLPQAQVTSLHNYGVSVACQLSSHPEICIDRMRAALPQDKKTDNELLREIALNLINFCKRLVSLKTGNPELFLDFISCLDVARYLLEIERRQRNRLAWPAEETTGSKQRKDLAASVNYYLTLFAHAGTDWTPSQFDRERSRNMLATSLPALCSPIIESQAFKDLTAKI